MDHTEREALAVLCSQAVEQKMTHVHCRGGNSEQPLEVLAMQTAEVLANQFLDSPGGSECLAKVLVLTACNPVRVADHFFKLRHEWLARIAWFLQAKAPCVLPNTGRNDSSFRRALLGLCQDTFEHYFSKDDSTWSLQKARRTHLVHLVQFLGHLYLTNLLNSAAFRNVLTELMDVNDNSLRWTSRRQQLNQSRGLRRRVECLHAILKVCGQPFAERDASFLVSIVAQVVELVGETPHRQIGRLVAEIQDMCSHWQPKVVLTVHAHIADDYADISCTNIIGEEVCFLDTIAGLTCSEFVKEVTSQLEKPSDLLTFVLPSGCLLRLDRCEDAELLELIHNA